MGAITDRAAQVTVLAWDAPGGQTRNLFTLIRHRRRDALGPWASEPDETWSERNNLGHQHRLLTFDGPFERCQAWVDRIRDSGMLPVNDREIRYALEPVLRRRWAYRDDRPLSVWTAPSRTSGDADPNQSHTENGHREPLAAYFAVVRRIVQPCHRHCMPRWVYRHDRQQHRSPEHH
jgi:hypothetical protein